MKPTDNPDYSGYFVRIIERLDHIIGLIEPKDAQPPPDPPAERTDPEAPQDWQGPHLHRCPDCTNEHWDRQPKPGETHAGDCICADCGYGLF